MPRLLVTGANGQLGCELSRRGDALGWAVLGRARADLDISDRDAVLRAVADAGVDVVINAAAYTAVDLAEQERARAFAVNAAGPGHLAQACAAHGLPLIHISTDYVFDGSKIGAYREDDPVAPINIYGASKEAGERAVREALPAHVILRTSWVYSAHGRNFVLTMRQLAAERDDAQCGRGPAWVADLGGGSGRRDPRGGAAASPAGRQAMALSTMRALA